MNPLTTQWREDAKKLRDAANELMSDDRVASLAADVRLQITVIVGKITAKMLDIQADSLDYLASASSTDASTVARRKLMEKNDAVRQAAAVGQSTGNWSAFDKLAGVPTPGAADGSGGPAG